MRKLLVVGVGSLFAFAQLAFAGAACAVGASGCPPVAATVAVHGHGHEHGRTCAMQTIAAQSSSTATPSADWVNAAAPAPAAALVAPPPIATSHPLYRAHVADATFLVIATGRLRL